MSNNYYLKPNLVIEPLFDSWYAWAHLISPATSAMNIQNRHLKIMNSYIQAPQIHAAAVQNPKMRGGPFMDFKGKRVDEVKDLKNQTLATQEKMIKLASAIKELDNLLKNEAHGYSLHELYQRVPEPVKGYVELVYDLNNNPSLRFFEPLLFRSAYYNKESQSIALWLTNNDERPFVLSTPRLPEPEVLQLQIPFDHEGIDLISRMKRLPSSIEHIAEILKINPSETQLFESFFTTESPEAYERYDGDKVRMRYFGHACILIETKNVSILVDPLISYYGYESKVDHFSDVDLPDVIDYILITHNHQDHVLFETLLPLRHKTRNIVVPKGGGGALQDPNLKLILNNIGFENVIEINDMETIRFLDCEVTGLPFIGEHSDLDIKTKACYHIAIEEFSLIFFADSCNVEPNLYKHVQSIIGNVDVVFLGMECDGAPMTWLYGPLLTEDLARDKDNTRRLCGSNYERGIELVNIFKPTEVYVYAMGQEPWVEFISSIKYTDESNPIVASNRLIDECKANGVIAERLYGEKEILYSKKRNNVVAL